MPLARVLTHLLMMPALAGAAEPATYFADLRAELQKDWPHNRRVTVVCHGHSVPTGYFVTPEVRPFDAYPHLLRVALKDRYPKGVLEVICTGIGGENSEQGAKRFAADVLAKKPDVVTIDYSLNDRPIGLERARAAWSQMITEAKDAGVRLILLTPTADKRSDLANPDDPLVQHAAQVRALAQEHDVALADSLAAFQQLVAGGGDLAAVMVTGNHPNRAGHELVVPGLLEWFVEPSNP